ncbi:hypothetical protein BDZ45DRAFT_736092 [Acephala macrosclerotiorum]|nr:hypothetical protein BDZ45DRAFT_736092 [Acephala macrosclerotiorum]
MEAQGLALANWTWIAQGWRPSLARESGASQESCLPDRREVGKLPFSVFDSSRCS